MNEEVISKENNNNIRVFIDFFLYLFLGGISSGFLLFIMVIFLSMTAFSPFLLIPSLLFWFLLFGSIIYHDYKKLRKYQFIGLAVSIIGSTIILIIFIIFGLIIVTRPGFIY